MLRFQNRERAKNAKETQRSLCVPASFWLLLLGEVCFAGFDFLGDELSYLVALF